jgi:hypothetical protein
VETLREIYELMNTRFAALKRGDLDDLVAFFHAEVIIEMVDTPDPETYQGHDGVRRWSQGPGVRRDQGTDAPIRRGVRASSH